jgi:hypothetical protein
LSKVPNSGTQPLFSLELVDLGIAFWIRGQKFGEVCTVCGGNLGMLVFYSFEFLLLQVSMVAMVVRRKEKSKEDRRESKKTRHKRRRKEFQERKKLKMKSKKYYFNNIGNG